jgi:hypothetical protein
MNEPMNEPYGFDFATEARRERLIQELQAAGFTASLARALARELDEAEVTDLAAWLRSRRVYPSRVAPFEGR